MRPISSADEERRRTPSGRGFRPYGTRKLTGKTRTPAVEQAKPPLRLASGLRTALQAGYSAADFRADLAGGIVVGVVAVPLSMALAIASGVPPQYGLYTAIIAGALIALLGGTRCSVSGPTAAFVVLLAPISARYGLGGLVLASFLAGWILILLGIARLGRLIEFVPHPVTTGFTAGIAVVIATLQFKDLLGLQPAQNPDHFLERVGVLVQSLPTAHWRDFSIGIATLAVLLLWPRVTRKVPAPVVALTSAGLAAALLHHFLSDFDVATINSRFSYVVGNDVLQGIPSIPPLPIAPWSLPGADGEPLPWSIGMFRELAAPAFAIAMLSAIESLLCAVVADGMTGSKHDPDVELVAQGIGNVVAPLFGGFAATAAIARTATGIRAGARSPIAPIVHAAFVLLSIVFLAPVLGYLPMSALAALLLVVAWNMSDAKHFAHIVRVAPRADTIVLLTCFLLTIVFDMVISVTVGVLLAAVLFMRQMAEISSVTKRDGKHPQLIAPLPPGVLLYEIAGPLFFGAAERAAGALQAAVGRGKAVILYMGGVPTMDVTGLVALETAIHKLQKTGTLVVLAGVQAGPRRVMENAGLHPEPGRLSICRTLEEAEMLVRLVSPDYPAPAPEAA